MINKPSTVQKAMETAKNTTDTTASLCTIFAWFSLSLPSVKLKKKINAINEPHHLSIKQYETHDKEVNKELILGIYLEILMSRCLCLI